MNWLSIMNLKKILIAIAEPFLAKKVNEVLDGAQRPSPEQATTQIGKLGAGASIAMLTQVESPEATIAMIVVLVVNLAFIYYPAK